MVAAFFIESQILVVEDATPAPIRTLEEETAATVPEDVEGLGEAPVQPGESCMIGRGSGDWKTSRLTMHCIQVVPHLGWAAMTMSSVRGR
jgi:hypothetical protein